MKKMLFILALCVGFSTGSIAANKHVYPNDMSPKTSDNKLKWANSCEIEIVNNSFDDVNVFGTFDDGALLAPFTIKWYDFAHYISLYYYGYCHAGMHLYLETTDGMPLYSSFTLGGTTIKIKTYFGKGLKAESSQK